MAGSLDESPQFVRKTAMWVARRRLAEAIDAAWQFRRVRIFLVYKAAERILDDMIARQIAKR